MDAVVLVTAGLAACGTYGHAGSRNGTSPAPLPGARRSANSAVKIVGVLAGP
jgi:hypothetical protein